MPRARASASSTSTVSATATSSRNASRSSNERRTSRRAARKALVVAPGESLERVRPPPRARGPSATMRSATGAGLVVPAEDEQRERGAVAADRPLGASRAPSSSAASAAAAAPASSPAIRRQRRTAIGRPQLAAGAARQLVSYSSAARLSHSAAGSPRHRASATRDPPPRRRLRSREPEVLPALVRRRRPSRVLVDRPRALCLPVHRPSIEEPRGRERAAPD